MNFKYKKYFLYFAIFIAGVSVQGAETLSTKATGAYSVEVDLALLPIIDSPALERNENRLQLYSGNALPGQSRFALTDSYAIEVRNLLSNLIKEQEFIFGALAEKEFLNSVLKSQDRVLIGGIAFDQGSMNKLLFHIFRPFPGFFSVTKTPVRDVKKLNNSGFHFDPYNFIKTLSEINEGKLLTVESEEAIDLVDRVYDIDFFKRVRVKKGRRSVCYKEDRGQQCKLFSKSFFPKGMIKGHKEMAEILLLALDAHLNYIDGRATNAYHWERYAPAGGKVHIKFNLTLKGAENTVTFPIRFIINFDGPQRAHFVTVYPVGQKK